MRRLNLSTNSKLVSRIEDCISRQVTLLFTLFYPCSKILRILPFISMVPCGPFIDRTNTPILRADQFDTKMSVFVENENALQS